MITQNDLMTWFGAEFAKTGLLRCEIELFIHFVWIYWNDPVSATSAENI